MATEVLADDRTLREERRRRAFDQMEAHGIDVLLLGREANARYVSGAPRLWTAGTRPFGPSCVVVRATGAIHLVSTWDEGIPEEIPHEHLFGITWNPGNLLTWLRGIEGAAEARRVGTDSLTPRFAQLLPKVFPSAELVDAEPALQAARRIKTPAEVAAIRASIAVAEDAVAASVSELRPGVSVHALAGTFMDAMAGRGVTTPATQRVAWITSRPSSGEIVQAGDVVAFDGGVVTGGYTGEVGRTWPVSPAAGDRHAALFARAEELSSRMVAACRAGASGAEVLAAYDEAGVALPPFPVGSGLGMGFDVPVLAGDLRRTAAGERLEPGVVLALTAYVRDAAGAVLRKDAVVVTDDGPQMLTTSPHWQSQD